MRPLIATASFSITKCRATSVPGTRCAFKAAGGLVGCTKRNEHKELLVVAYMTGAAASLHVEPREWNIPRIVAEFSPLRRVRLRCLL
jgi:hypothetical protein